MTIKDKIQEWCDSSIAKLIVQYDQSGRRASGNWEKELESKVEQTQTGYKVQILGAYYSYWMENGRNPSAKFPPIDAILKWIEEKPILAPEINKKSLAFLIARKISKEGYKSRPLASAIFTDQWIEELMQSIGLFFIQEFKSDILLEFKK